MWGVVEERQRAREVISTFLMLGSDMISLVAHEGMVNALHGSLDWILLHWYLRAHRVRSN